VPGSAGFLALTFLPLLVLVSRRGRVGGGLALVALLFTLCWAWSAQLIRYLFPALFIVTALAGWAMVVVWRALGEQKPRLAWLAPGMFVLGVGLQLPVLIQQSGAVPTGIPFQVVLGQVSREDYRAQAIPAQQTLAYASATLDGEQRIYAVAETYQFLSDVPLLTPHFSLAGDRILFASSEQALLAELVQSRITHVLINYQALPAHWDFLIHQTAFLSTYATLEYQANDVALYRLTLPAAPTLVAEHAGVSAETGPLTIVHIYPEHAEVGVEFNVQPDGESALGVVALNATPDVVIMLNDEPLETVYASPRLVSATIPEEVLDQPGRHEIYLQNGEGRSNRVEFVVDQP
jgi:hypothetical protein